MTFFRTKADEGYDLASAEIGFILDLQLAIETALDRQGLSQADLARLMGVTDARVSQMMSDSGANLRARTIGRVGAALGLKPCVRFEDASSAAGCEAVSMGAWVRGEAGEASPNWGRAIAANDMIWEEIEQRPLRQATAR